MFDGVGEWMKGKIRLSYASFGKGLGWGLGKVDNKAELDHLGLQANWRAWQNHPMVPTLDHFQREKLNHSISCQNDQSVETLSFLQTFERHSGLKIFPVSKTAILKWLHCQNFMVIGLEEMPI